MSPGEHQADADRPRRFRREETMQTLRGKVLRIVLVAASTAFVTLGAVSAAGAITPGPSVASVRLHVGPGIGGPGSIVAISGRLPCEQLSLTFQPRVGVTTRLGNVLAPAGKLAVHVRIPAGAPGGRAIIAATGTNPSLCRGSGTFYVVLPVPASGSASRSDDR
jgi:hypothetical protein